MMVVVGSTQAEGRSRVPIAVAVAAGGALGAPARYALDRAVTVGGGDFPWGTFVVNVSGCFALGALVGALLAHWPTARYARAFGAAGFLGSFTTFSTFALEVDLLVERGHLVVAAAYVVASLFAGLAATAVGLTIARWSADVFHRDPMEDVA
jgi:CrcB protein